MNVAVIPARGGSKRIPRKNIKEFCGRPMIAWSVEIARSSGLFDHVLLSTEDSEIADVARQYGAEVLFTRPAELADDHAGTTEVVGHATRWVVEKGWPVTAVCCLYATAPLVQKDDLRRGLTMLESGDWAYAFSATTFPSPIFRSFREVPEGGIEMFFPEYFQSRSQDLPTALHDAGQFYWGRPSAWMTGKRIYDRHSVPVMIPRWRVADIDDEEDWKHAEMVFRQLRDGGSGDRLSS
jgi:pseudaminic acid cytidylyltransferase